MPTVREAVLSLLLRCEAAGQYANIALDTALQREKDLSPSDKGLFTALFYGVIEHKLTLDYQIDQRSSIPPSAIEGRVRMILRLALCQLLYFDRVPDHAAINEAVSMTPRRSKGFVNAILRGFCREEKRLVLPDPADICSYLSVRYSVSPSVAEALCRVFGAVRAEAVLAAFAAPPAITVRINTCRISPEAFFEQVEGAKPTPYAPFGAVLSDGAALRPLLEKGLCFVQDEASQLAVAALGLTAPCRVLDLCAAPGSKSFGAAITMGDAGEVKSFDLHENKLSLIRSGARSLGLSSLTVAAGDARLASAEVLGEFDRVICDVPCSGLGVIGKKPDIRYKEMAAAAGLPPVQAAILQAAAGLVKKGGILVYSTCTLLPEENEEQVRAFLAANPAFSLVGFGEGAWQNEGMLTLTPERFGTDGFFIAKLQKRN